MEIDTLLAPVMVNYMYQLEPGKGYADNWQNILSRCALGMILEDISIRISKGDQLINAGRHQPVL